MHEPMFELLRMFPGSSRDPGAEKYQTARADFCCNFLLHGPPECRVVERVKRKSKLAKVCIYIYIYYVILDSIILYIIYIYIYIYPPTLEAVERVGGTLCNHYTK